MHKITENTTHSQLDRKCFEKYIPIYTLNIPYCSINNIFYSTEVCWRNNIKRYRAISHQNIVNAIRVCRGNQIYSHHNHFSCNHIFRVLMAVVVRTMSVEDSAVQLYMSAAWRRTAGRFTCTFPMHNDKIILSLNDLQHFLLIQSWRPYDSISFSDICLNWQREEHIHSHTHTHWQYQWWQEQ